MSNRDRWMLTLIPAVLTVGAYVYGVRGQINKDLEEAVARAESAEKKKGSGTSVAQLQTKQREISDTEEKLSASHKRVQQLETELNAAKNRKVELAKPVEALQLPPNHPAALVQQRLRRIFEKHGLTRAASDDAERADPSGIVTALVQAAPELQSVGTTRTVHRFRIVGTCKVLRAFLDDLATLEPAALPLTFELTRDGEFQVMEMTLWLWF